MKPPKNFYSNLDRRKQGLPEVPEASAADAGKIIKVGETGAYELVADGGSDLPVVNTDDNGKILKVTGGEWSKSDYAASSMLGTNVNGRVYTTKSVGMNITQSGSTITRSVNGSNRTFSNILADGVSQLPMAITFLINGTRYSGFVQSILTATNTIISFVRDTDGNPFIITSVANDNTVTPIGSTVGTKYYEITASGSSVSLPSGVTFADVYAELMAGVDVKFTSGARVYSVTSFESTNIRAHWMSDLDLTNMDVSVINLESDGTGTVNTVTFSGS